MLGMMLRMLMMMGYQKDREVFQSELAGKSLTVTLLEIQDGLINLRNP